MNKEVLVENSCDRADEQLRRLLGSAGWRLVGPDLDYWTRKILPGLLEEAFEAGQAHATAKWMRNYDDTAVVRGVLAGIEIASRKAKS